jgi:hypothetical protein
MTSKWRSRSSAAWTMYHAIFNHIVELIPWLLLLLPLPVLLLLLLLLLLSRPGVHHE